MKAQVIDKKPVIEQHKNDLNNYYLFIQKLADNTPAWIFFKEHKSPTNKYQLFHEIEVCGGKNIGRITPYFADKENALYKLEIELCNKRLDAEKFKAIAEETLKNCVGLEKITIETF